MFEKTKISEKEAGSALLKKIKQIELKRHCMWGNMSGLFYLDVYGHKAERRLTERLLSFEACLTKFYIGLKTIDKVDK